MPTERMTTPNVTLQVQPNGDVDIRRRVSSIWVEATIGLLFIAFGLWMLREGMCFAVALLAAALLPLIQSGKELRRPNILIEKSPRRVTQQLRWLSQGAGQSWSLDAFAGAAYYITTGRRGIQMHQVGLVFSDGKLFPLARITPTQREQVMSLLTTATGLPKLELKNRWEQASLR
jgi:hypothetical protein